MLEGKRFRVIATYRLPRLLLLSSGAYEQGCDRHRLALPMRDSPGKENCSREYRRTINKHRRLFYPGFALSTSEKTAGSLFFVHEILAGAGKGSFMAHPRT